MRHLITVPIWVPATLFYAGLLWNFWEFEESEWGLSFTLTDNSKIKLLLATVVYLLAWVIVV